MSNLKLASAGLFLSLFVVVVPANAIIVLYEDSTGYGVNGGGVQSGPYEITAFDVAGSDKLVVGVTNEGGGVPTSVTYAGQALTLAQSSSQHPSSQMGIFYLDNPLDFASSGTIEAIFSATSNGPGIVAVALSGTAAGYDNSVEGGTNSNTATLDTTSDNTFILAVAGSQWGSPGDNAVTNSVFTEFTTGPSGLGPFNGNNGHEIGSAHGSAAYLLAGPAGPYTATFTGLNPQRQKVIAVSFSAIPEPSQAALMAVAGVGFAAIAFIRKRRQSSRQAAL